MNRPCSGCGEYDCDGIACYMESPTPPTTDELIAIAVHELEKKYLKRDEKRRAA